MTMRKFDFAAATVPADPTQTPISDLIRHRSTREMSLQVQEGLGRQLPVSRPICPIQDEPNLPPFSESELDNPQLLKSAAAEIYRMRRSRDRIMPADLTGEPGWDILLALYAEGPSELTVSSVCYGAGVPATTAMRWVAALDSRGFVQRTKHARDKRLILCSLTDEGRLIVERCLRAMLRSARA